VQPCPAKPNSASRTSRGDEMSRHAAGVHFVRSELSAVSREPSAISRFVISR